jgi:hypothetical protein
MLSTLYQKVRGNAEPPSHSIETLVRVVCGVRTVARVYLDERAIRRGRPSTIQTIIP